MNNMNQHERARLLLEERSLGIIGDHDSAWLRDHLDECARCSDAEAELTAAIAMLRSDPVTAPAFLVSRTRTGVRIRARELAESAERTRMLALSLILAFVFSGITFYGGYMLYSAWTAMTGTGAVLSTVALVWIWFAPAVLLLFMMKHGKSEWLGSLQQIGSGRRFDND